MSKLNLNKNYLYAIMSVIFVAVAAVIGYFVMFGGSERKFENVLQTAAKEYLEENNIAIEEGSSIDLPAEFLAQKNYFNSNEIENKECIQYTDVNISNVDGENVVNVDATCSEVEAKAKAKVMTIDVQELADDSDTIIGSEDAPAYILDNSDTKLYGRARYSSTVPVPIGSKVLVTIVFNMPIDELQYYVADEEFAALTDWTIQTAWVKINYTSDGGTVKTEVKKVSVATKEYSDNVNTSVYGYHVQTVAGRDIISRKSVSIDIHNIDNDYPTFSGVENNGVYITDKTITFTDAFDTRYGYETKAVVKNLTNPSEPDITSTNGTITVPVTANQEVEYSLVVTDFAGNSTDVIEFTMHGKTPVITDDQLKDGGLYNHAISVPFDGGTATISGVKKTESGDVTVDTTGFVSGNTVNIPANDNEEVVYTLTITDGYSTITKTFTIDTIKPVITLNNASQNPQVVIKGTTYNELGASVTDNIGIDTNLEGANSDGIKITGTVDVNTAGTYTITYTARDLAGNDADSVFRTIQVVDRDGLQGSIADATSKDKDDYSTDSFEKLEDALDKANDVLNNPNSTIDDIADAKKDLDDALAKLVLKPVILSSVIESLNQKDPTHYAKAGDEIKLTFVSSRPLNVNDSTVTFIFGNSRYDVKPELKDGKYVATTVVPDSYNGKVSYEISAVSAERDTDAYASPVYGVGDLTGESTFVVDSELPIITVDKELDVLNKSNSNVIYNALTGVTAKDGNVDMISNLVIKANGTEVTNGEITILPTDKEIVITYELEDGAGNPAKSKTKTIRIVDRSALQDLINDASNRNEEDYGEESWNWLQDVLESVNGIVNKTDVTEKELEDAASDLQDVLDNIIERPVLTYEEFNSKNKKNPTLYAKEGDEIELVFTSTKELDLKLTTVKFSFGETIVDGTLRFENNKYYATVKVPKYNGEVGYEVKGVNGVLDIDGTTLVPAKNVLSGTSTFDVDSEAPVITVPYETKVIDKATLTDGRLDVKVATATDGSTDLTSDIEVYNGGNLLTDGILTLEADTDTYTITYKVSDGAGNPAEEKQIVFTIIDKSGLSDLIDEAEKVKEDINSGKYTDASKNNFNNALENAKDVLNDPDATKEEIQEAIDNLNDAINKKVLKLVVTFVDFVTNNASGRYTRTGDEITLTFTSTILLDLESTTVLFKDIEVTDVKLVDGVYTAKMTVPSTFSTGRVLYTINPVAQQKEADGSQVIGDTVSAKSAFQVDRQKPTITIDENKKLEVIDVNTTYGETEIRNGVVGADNYFTDTKYNLVNYTIRDLDTNTTIQDATAIDTSEAGNYLITYTLVDFAGNSAKAQTRTVRVVNREDLRDILVDAKSKDEESFTEDTYKDLLDAITAGEAVVDKADVTQKELDDAYNLINSALSQLKAIPSVGSNVTFTSNNSKDAINYAKAEDILTLEFTSEVLLDMSSTTVVFTGLESVSDTDRTFTYDETTGKYTATIKVPTGYNGVVNYVISPVSTNNIPGPERTGVSTFVVDTTAPDINIPGGQLILVEKDTQLPTLPNVTATDNGQSIPVSSTSVSIDITTADDYTITYTAEDGAGNPAEENLVVRVLNLDILRQEEAKLNDLETTKSDYTEESWNNKKNLIDELNGIINGTVSVDDEITQEFVNTKMDAIQNATLVVKGLDMDAYNEQVARLTGLVGSDYVDGQWDTVQAAKNIEGITLQSKLDEQVAILKAAIDALTPKTFDKTELDELNKVLENLKESDYTADSWNALQNVITTATNATLKSEYDAVKDQLVTSGLVPNTFDKTELDTLKEALKNLEESDYTADSWNALQNVITTATNATLKSEYDAVKDQLVTSGLVAKGLDLTEYNAQLDRLTGLVSTDYTVESWNAVETAKNIDGITLQSKLDEQVAKLQDAIDKLQLATVDKSALDAIKDALSKLNKDDYTEESWNNLQKEIARVDAITKQSEFDEEVKKIDINSLALIPKISNITMTTSNASGKYVRDNETITFSFDSNDVLDLTNSQVYIRFVNGSLDITPNLVKDENSNRYTYSNVLPLNTHYEDGEITYYIKPVTVKGETIDAIEGVGAIKVDNTPPTISLDGDSEITVEVGSTLSMVDGLPVITNIKDNSNPSLTATADDNYSKNLNVAVDASGVVLTSVGDYTITYNVSDEAGNPAAQVVRTVHVVDTTAPTFDVEPPKVILVEKNKTYTLPVITATDNYVQNVTVTNDDKGIDTSVPGDYTVTYTATDGTNSDTKATIVRVLDLDILRTEEGRMADLELFANDENIFEPLNSNRNDYTKESLDAKKALIKELNDIIAGNTDVLIENITQDYVNEKMSAIKDFKLVPVKPLLDKFNEQLAIANGLLEGDYTADSWNTLVNAMNQDVDSMELQTQVNVATYYLSNAISNIVPENFERYVTSTVLNLQLKLWDDYVRSDYTQESYQKAQDAINNLKYQTIYYGGPIKIKSEYDKILKEVDIDKILVILDIDDSELVQAETDMSSLESTKDDYTPESWEARKNAIEAARAIADRTDPKPLRSEFEAAMVVVRNSTLVEKPNAIDVELSNNNALGKGYVKFDDTITLTFGSNVELLLPDENTVEGTNVTTVKMNGNNVPVTYDSVSGKYVATLTLDTNLNSLNGKKVTYEIVTYGKDGTQGKVISNNNTDLIYDFEPPKISLNNGVTDETVAYKEEVTVSFDDVKVSDNLTSDEDLVISINGQVVDSTNKEITIDTTTLGRIEIIYRVRDLAGYEETTTRYITVADEENPVINLNGDSEVTIEVGSTYQDAGATATDNYDGDLTSKIVVNNPVDTNVVDTYTVTYNVTDSNNNSATEVTRTVKVVDTTIPVITLEDNDTPTIVQVGGSYVEPGYTATDNYDGDITDNVVVSGLDKLDTTKVADYVLKYNVTDANGNKAVEVTRIIKVVDTKAPVITLIGENPVTVQVGVDYQDAGATAIDNYEGDISSRIIVTGTVNTKVPGEYTLYYNVSDYSGNAAIQVTRTVIVADTVAPEVDFKILNPTTNEWYGESIQVKVSGQDASGISKLEYQLVIDGTLGEWRELNLDNPIFMISNNSANIKFNVRSTDGAGNVSDVKPSDTYKLDVLKPEIDEVITSGVYDKVTTWYKSAVTVNVEASDNASGVKSIMYAISKDAGQTWSDWTTVSGASAQFTITDNLSTIMYKVKVVDNAGNESDEDVSSLIKIDTVLPVISVQYDGKTYTESFDVIIDANKVNTFVNPEVTSDGELTTNGTIDNSVLGVQTITYTSVDEAGNITTVVMTVNVQDKTAPEITLNGEEEVSIKYGSQYNELGATAMDAYDGEVDVEITGSVNAYKVGTYTITYTAKDAAGNVSTKTRKVNVVKATTSEVIKDGNNCQDGEDCYNTQVVNNYVWYSGHLWRVIKVNENDTVKLVTEDSIAGIAYDGESSVYAGSDVQDYLLKEFYPELNNAKNLIVDGDYCNEKMTSLTKVRYTCAANSVVKSKIGLLTIDEYNIIGGEEGYLNNGTWFFTMTPTKDANVWVVKMDGTKERGYNVIEPYAIRPVITMKSLDIVSGSGTANDPYHIQGDSVAQAGDKLNTRVSGEYVKFGDEMWRIVEASGSQTKLIYDGVIIENDMPVQVVYGEYGKFEKDSYIYNYLNETIMNKLFNSTEEELILNSRWFSNPMVKGDSPRNTSLVIGSQYTEAKIGLPYVGELMTGWSSTNSMRPMDRFTVWTMNYNPNFKGNQWYLTSVGTSDYLDGVDRGISPVINLHPKLTIGSGNGTYQDPYVLEY